MVEFVLGLVILLVSGALVKVSLELRETRRLLVQWREYATAQESAVDALMRPPEQMLLQIGESIEKPVVIEEPVVEEAKTEYIPTSLFTLDEMPKTSLRDTILSLPIGGTGNGFTLRQWARVSNMSRDELNEIADYWVKEVQDQFTQEGWEHFVETGGGFTCGVSEPQLYAFRPLTLESPL